MGDAAVAARWRLARFWIVFLILAYRTAPYLSPWFLPLKDTAGKSQRRLHENATLPRLLYIVTSMNEYDTGMRGTSEGYDRFSRTIVPVMKEATRSMLQAGYAVDVYLISHYRLLPERYDQLRSALPANVDLTIWDDATPIGYAWENSKTHLAEVTRALARQHRYVIKDRILDYDFFVNFEDDILIRGAQVQHYDELSNELYRLRKQAHERHDVYITDIQAGERFFGEMTRMQLLRTIPGFIRVEARLPNADFRDDQMSNIMPKSYQWKDGETNANLDPAICCHVPEDMVNNNIPAAPTQDELYLWETRLEALGVRKLPEESKWDWILMQGGCTNEIYFDTFVIVGDYWTGRDGYFKERLDKTKSDFVNNQGGWMATRRQIYEWHTHLCAGSFLPPYEKPFFPYDGLDLKTVEFWSGGGHIFGPMACNLQRIITLEPSGFSKQLLYHTSNNKQKSRGYRFKSGTIRDFWAQLNTVRQNAETAMHQALNKAESIV